MASQALYRKWRSQTFHELVGQEHVVQTLRNAVVEDRVAHAYLFTGPRGVGKTSMARLLAKAVNCTAPQDQRPCGVCASCVAVSENRAVDVIEMDAASHTSVDDAREIIERVQFRPTTGRYKVYIIDEVHMLSTAAFNALLKTLEEPPDHAIFIMATTEVHKVPATILSRCQRFTFTRHTIAEIAGHLQRIADEEGLTLEEGVTQMIARAATGSMRDALGVLEQLASFTSGSIAAEQVQNLLGMTAASEVDSLIEALLASDLQQALKVVNHIADQGADMRQFARDLVERLRSLMLLVATGDSTLLGVGTDDLTLLEGWTQQAAPGKLVQWIKVLSGLDYQLRTSPYGHLPLELALVEVLVAPAPAAAPVQPGTVPAARPAKAAPRREPPPAPARPAAPPKPSPEPSPPPAAAAPAEQQTPPPSTPVAAASEQTVMTSNGSNGEDAHESGDAAPPEPVPSAPAAVAPPPALETVEAVQHELSVLERIEQAWPAILRDVRPHNNRLEAILRDVHPVDVEEQTIVLQARSPFHYTQVEKVQSRRIIEQVIEQHLGQAFGIRCITQEQTKQDDARQQIQSLRTDPRVKAARNIFGAEVIEVLKSEE